MKQARNRITIETRAEATDDYGGQTVTWTSLGTFWAIIKPISTFERAQHQTLKNESTHKFIIRYNKSLANIAVVGESRITHQSRIYSVTGSKNFDHTLKNYGRDFQIIEAVENRNEPS